MPSGRRWWLKSFYRHSLFTELNSEFVQVQFHIFIWAFAREPFTFGCALPKIFGLHGGLPP
jgi:hypothetical protein